MSAIAPIKRAVKSTIRAISHWRVPRVEPVIVATLPHDPAAFTQGLCCHNSCLYESTGGETNSTLRRLNIEDGSVEMRVPIQDDYAEGIAVVDDRLYQLSWKSGTAREYRLPELDLVATYRYRGEGWGMCAWRGRLLHSDGSHRLRWSDTNFQSRGSIHVTSNGVPVGWLNDLECVGDRVYVNVVACNYLLDVCVVTGRVQRVVDCHQLVALESPESESSQLNGIAYWQDRNLFFVTGKRWRSLYVISIPS
jgi:glutaminyl-peptide cyclotransferase